MSAVAFFGHRDYDFAPYAEKIREKIVSLIEAGAATFYNGMRGNFDVLCAEIVRGLKPRYPHIENVMVLSYLPREGWRLPRGFDGSVYLLERPVPPRFAIFHTDRAIAKRADFIIAGIVLKIGGAWAACRYAQAESKYGTLWIKISPKRTAFWRFSHNGERKKGRAGKYHVKNPLKILTGVGERCMMGLRRKVSIL